MKQSKNIFSLLPNLLLILIVLVSLNNCDNSLNPIKETTLYNYSMYGILDLSVDTQWVRVGALRSQLPRDSSQADAKVTLERESTGEVVQLRDTLIKLAQDSYVWNYWTTENLVENEIYTIRATSPEGEVTSGTATIPSAFETKVAQSSGNRYQYSIRIESPPDNVVVAEVLYAFRVIWPILRDTSYYQLYPVSHMQDLQNNNDDLILSIDDIPTIANSIGIAEEDVINVSAEFTFVTADSNWAGSSEINEQEFLGQASNVKNGLGVVTGIVSKRVPLVGCDDPRNEVVACSPSN